MDNDYSCDLIGVAKPPDVIADDDPFGFMGPKLVVKRGVRPTTHCEVEMFEGGTGVAIKASSTAVDQPTSIEEGIGGGAGGVGGRSVVGGGGGAGMAVGEGRGVLRVLRRAEEETAETKDRLQPAWQPDQPVGHPVSGQIARFDRFAFGQCGKPLEMERSAPKRRTFFKDSS